MQRLLLLLVIGSLAAAAWFIGTGTHAPDEGDLGLVVHVYLADRAGKPVAPAQVIQVYDRNRVRVDGSGYVRLTHVTLRADEEPSATSLPFAIKPLAHFHASRRGFAPTVTQREDGSWEVRYALHGYGILRVHVESVALGKCRAFLEPDLPLQRWEPVGGHSVVRTGSVVDFRIYQGWDHVFLRLKGDIGKDGVPTVASQRHKIEVPSPGHTAQVRIIPDPVDPILGIVKVGKGPTPPTLRGQLLVRTVAEDGSRLDLGETPIDDEGNFVVRDAGTGTYELVARLDAFSGATTITTKGGEYVEVELEGEAGWIVIKHPQLDLQGRAPRWWFAYSMSVTSLSGRPASTLAVGPTKTLLMLPPLLRGLMETGTTCYVVLTLPGTRKAAPLRGSVELSSVAGGMPSGRITPEVVPHATVTVRMDPATWGAATSARVSIGSRVATLVKGTKNEVIFQHVACTLTPYVDLKHKAFHMVEGKPTLSVVWNDGGALPIKQVLSLESGSNELVEVRRVERGP